MKLSFKSRKQQKKTQSHVKKGSDSCFCQQAAQSIERGQNVASFLSQL